MQHPPPDETASLIVNDHDDSSSVLRPTLWMARFSKFLTDKFPGYAPHGNLQESWRYFEYYTLPRRKKEAPYCKAAPGSADSELYPLCTHNLQDFGTGIAVYFDTLLALIGICLGAGILYLPSIYHYASDGYTSTEVYTVAGPLRGSWLCPEPEWVPCPSCVLEQWADNPSRFAQTSSGLAFAMKNTCAPLYWGQGLNHLIVMIFVSAGVLYLGHYQRQQELSYDESVLTASDYSIQVDNPPEFASDPNEWKEFFQQFGDVKLVTVALNNHDLVRLLVQRRGLLQSAWYKSSNTSTIPKEQQQIPPTLESSHPKLFRKIQKVEEQCRLLLKKTYPTSGVFVTFELERSQRRALKALRVGQMNVAQNNTSALPAHYLFRNNLVLDVAEAPEPSAIRWQDLDETKTRKVIERIVTCILTIIVVAAGFGLVKRAFKSNVNLAATEIAILNMLMPHVFKKINALESHQSESSYQASLYWKVTIFRWVNTAIVTVLIKPSTATLSDTPNGLVRAVHAILKAEIVVAPVLHMLDIPGLLKRHVFVASAQNQAAMNSYFRGSAQNLGEKYTNATKTIFLVFFYSAIFPSGFFYGAIALLLTYVTDKYLLLRSWGPIPKIGDDIARLSRKIFFPLTTVTLAVLSEFFYSAYPCDNLCDSGKLVDGDSPYHGQQNVTGSLVKVEEGDSVYHYCDQDFLERFDTLLDFFFAEKDEWMDGDQQAMSFTFGIFAVIIAGIMVFINLSDDVQEAQTEAWGGYSTSERDSGEAFSSQAKITAYVPQMPHSKFSFPFIAAHDSSAFSNHYIGWHDPVLGHDNYHLDADVNFLMRGRATAVLSRVCQYSAPEKGLL